MWMTVGVCISGGDNDGPWFLPDILVNVRRSGEDASVGVIREVLLVYTFTHNVFSSFFSLLISKLRVVR